jgi:hypothetical protein
MVRVMLCGERRLQKNKLLLLLQDTSILSLDVASYIFESFTPDYLIAAIMLTPDDLMDFSTAPLDYLNGCLLYCRDIEYSPRCTMAVILDKRKESDIHGLLDAIFFNAPCLSDENAIEATLFLLDLLASSAEIHLPDAMIGAIVDRLAAGPSAVETATLLMCLCRTDPSARFSELAFSYLRSSDVVQQTPLLAYLRATLISAPWIQSPWISSRSYAILQRVPGTTSFSYSSQTSYIDMRLCSLTVDRTSWASCARHGLRLTAGTLMD